MEPVYKRLDRIRNQTTKAQQRLEELCSISTHGMRIDPVGGGHSGGTSDPVAERAVKIVEQREQYERMIPEYIQTMKEFDSVLDGLRDAGIMDVMEAVVLSYRHCLGMDPEQIAKQIDKSERYVYLKLSSGHRKIEAAQDSAARDPP